MMKHTSENQKALTRQEIDRIHREARRKRYGDMILILENNGFKVSAVPKAIERESMQMIVILKARGYDITKGEVNNVQEQKEEDTIEAPKEESPEGNST